MQGHKNVTTGLNHCLAHELVIINQTFLHARMFRNWGLNGLNEPIYKESIRSMKRADDLIERILFLEGLPNLQHLGRLRVGETTSEMLQSDLSLTGEATMTLRTQIKACEDAQDYVSRALLAEHLASQEEYYDWLETQLELIQQLGLPNYLQSQA